MEEKNDLYLNRKYQQVNLKFMQNRWYFNIQPGWIK